MEEDDLLAFAVDAASLMETRLRLGTVRDVAAALTLRLSYFLANSSAKDAEDEEEVTAVAVNAVEVERNWIAKEHFMMLSSDRFMF